MGSESAAVFSLYQQLDEEYNRIASILFITGQKINDADTAGHFKSLHSISEG